MDKTAPTIKVKSTITPITIGTNAKVNRIFLMLLIQLVEVQLFVLQLQITGSLAIGSHEISSVQQLVVVVQQLQNLF